MTTAKENKPSAPSLPLDTNAALGMVMESMGQLSRVYEEETEALIAIDSNKFFAIQEKKYETALVYQSHMNEMLKRKNELKFSNPSIRSRLKIMQENFHDLSARNLEALERMGRCTERLAHTIRSAAVKSAQKQRHFSYGENGTLSNTTRNKVISSGLSETA